jgi:hypothetical protein
MLKWACHESPRIVPAERRYYHQHQQQQPHQHQQQQQQQQQHLAPFPAQAQQPNQYVHHHEEPFGGEIDPLELGGGEGFDQNPPALEPPALEPALEEMEQAPGVNMGQLIVGNGITFEQARARLEEIQNLPGNAKIDLYGLPDILHPPEGIFDDLNDDSGRWTDVLIEEHGETIGQERHHLKSTLTNSENRSKNRRRKFHDFDDNFDEETPEVDLGNRYYNYFCAFCFQRYQKSCAHTASLCRQGRVVRQLATLLHHGEQLPPLEQ